MVRAEGLEPPRLSSPEPKSGASTNSATPAASAGLTRPICFLGSISACPPHAIKKCRPDQTVRSFAHDSSDGDGEEANREQKAGCAGGAVGQHEHRQQKSAECDGNGAASGAPRWDRRRDSNPSAAIVWISGIGRARAFAAAPAAQQLHSPEPKAASFRAHGADPCAFLRATQRFQGLKLLFLQLDSRRSPLGADLFVDVRFSDS